MTISGSYAHAHVRLARKIYFSSGHLYRQKAFTTEQNREVFGRCFTPHGHGHNYCLEAYFQGPIDGKTGLVVNLMDVDKVLKQVVDPLDHQHLNFDVPYFKDLVPTTENLAKYCFEEIARQMPATWKMTLSKVRLFESDDLWVEYEAGA